MDQQEAGKPTPLARLTADDHPTPLHFLALELGANAAGARVGDIITLQMMNDAVDWWNARDDGSTTPDVPTGD